MRAPAQVRRRATLARRAIRDPLIGLFQRRYHAEARERAVCRTARHGRPRGVIMRAVDHFMRVNDPCGPGTGHTMLNRRAPHGSAVQALRQPAARALDAAQHGDRECGAGEPAL
jgi:diguanylate cyclase (GGDEF)-like protein